MWLKILGALIVVALVASIFLLDVWIVGVLLFGICLISQIFKNILQLYFLCKDLDEDVKTNKETKKKLW